MQLASNFTLVVRVFDEMATVLIPRFESGKSWNLVVKQAGTETLAPLFPAEPLQDVGFLTFTHELSGCPFGGHVVHGVVPSSARIGVAFPAVLLFRGSPVWNFESLEESSRLSVETDVSDALQEGVGVEVLSVEVEHDVGFLVELVVIYILNAHAYNNKLNQVGRTGQAARPIMVTLGGAWSEHLPASLAFSAWNL